MQLSSCIEFTYFGSNISSTESDVNLCIKKAWAAIDRLSIKGKPDLTDKIKSEFFYVVTGSIQQYGCTNLDSNETLRKKRLDGKYTRILGTALNKSLKQNLTKQQSTGHLPPISLTTKVRRTRHAGHCRRSKDEHISDVLIWHSQLGLQNKPTAEG